MQLTTYGARVDAAAQPLSRLLPLDIPLSMHIDPTNVCNFKCTFCPTANDEMLERVGRGKGQMSYELFCKIIDDLRILCDDTGKRLRTLHVYKDGEPLLNKNLPRMIAYAKQKNVSDSVETTTNASPLTQKVAIELIESGLDKIRISVESVSSAGYKQITETYSDYEKIIRNVTFLFNEKSARNSPLKIHAKIIDIGLSDQEKAKFLADFSGISDTINIDHLTGWSKTEEYDWKLGFEVDTGVNGINKITEKIVCAEPFSKLAVNFDGTVSVCCVDWSHGTVVGDLNQQSLHDIWHGAALREFRLKHLRGRRSEITPCANCDYIRGLPESSNLDASREHLITVYSKP